MGCGSSKNTSTAIVAFGSPKRKNRQESARGNQTGVGKGPENGEAMVSAVVALRPTSGSLNRSVDSGIGADSRDGSANLGRPAEAKSDIGLLKGINGGKPRMDEATILAALRQEGLLGAPNTSTSKGGLCFEVPADELKVRSRRPPVRLQRLEKGNQDNKKDLIKEKLDTAETRRKKREKEKIERNREKDTKNLEATLTNLENEERESLNSATTRRSSANCRIVSAKHRRRPPVTPLPLQHDQSDLVNQNEPKEQ